MYDRAEYDSEELALIADAAAKIGRQLLDTGKKAKEHEDRWAKYHDDPVGFFVDVLGVTPWEAEGAETQSQADLIRAIGIGDRVACKSGHKIGKMLHDDTPVPTPSGWRRHGDLKIGDQVFDESGRPCNVVNVIPWSNRPLMRVTFEDGTSIDADERHEWVVHSRESRKRTYKPAQTLETRQLAQALTVPNGSNPDGSPRRVANWTVDLPGAIELPTADLPLDPYLLGVWLGDGNSRGAAMTTADAEIQGAFERAGFDTQRKESKGAAWAFGITSRGRGEQNRFSQILRSLGVHSNKHVPREYLWASADQRLALLQGLMDTDGTCSEKGIACFTNTNEQIARSVQFLARSLGIKARISEGRAKLNGRDCGPVWDVIWCSPHRVFRLARKACRLRTAWKHKANAHKRMAIVSVEPLAERVSAQCITVDSPSHLYLAGEAMLPTHNSITAVGCALWFVCTRKKARVLLTAPTFAQVKNILWKELANVYRDRRLEAKLGAPLALDPSTGLRLPNGNEIIGISTKTTENLAGISAPEMLFIVDEASGFPDDLWEVLSKGNAAGGVKIFCISNPTRTSGWFFRIFRERAKFSRWQCFTISSENTPNARSGKRLVPGLATRDFIEEIRTECGAEWRDDPVYMVRIRGEFPPQGSDAVISLHAVERATSRWETTSPPDPELYELTIGVDVGRYGTDPSVAQPVRGSYAYEPREVYRADGPTVANMALAMARELRQGDEVIRMVVDGIGVGASVVDALKYSEDVQEGRVYLVDLNVGEAADEQAMKKTPDGKAKKPVHSYERLRDQLWFGVAEWLKSPQAALPNQERLGAELLVATYAFTANGKIKVLSKDLMRALLDGRSPDYADALAMAVYRGKRGKRIEYSYDGALDLRHNPAPEDGAWDDSGWGPG